MKLDVPLELQDKEFESLDQMQKDMICKYNALDLVLLENANELFRMYMQEGENNKKIEKLLELVGKEDSNSIFLPSNSFEIMQNKKGDWLFKNTKDNKNDFIDYILECNKKVKSVNKKTKIYTIMGLDLGEGGHYSGMVCDIEDGNIHVFDSMTGYYNDEYTLSGIHKLFMLMAKKLFIGEGVYTGLKALKKYKLKVNEVSPDYILQPTGGFEEFTAPILEKLNNKRLLKIINIQHTESQNHFCYIWSTWFIHIYLIGKLDLFKEYVERIKTERMIPLVVIKKYIMGIVELLDGKVKYKAFYNRRFAEIWSNHENPLENNYSLYGIKHKKCKTINECLENSLKDHELRRKESTSLEGIKKEVCKKK